MVRNGEEILADIDATLDQLIRNAEAIRGIAIESLYENEVEALQKTQESLLARLIHMDDLLDEEKKEVPQKRKSLQLHEIREKISEFGRLNSEMMDDVASRFDDEEHRPMAVKKIRLHRTPSLKAS